MKDLYLTGLCSRNFPYHALLYCHVSFCDHIHIQ